MKKLVVCLFLLSFSGFSYDCFRLMNKMQSDLPRFAYVQIDEIFQFDAEIEEASKILGISEDIFLKRLEKTKFGIKGFFDEVAKYRAQGKHPFFNLILNPKKLGQMIYEYGHNPKAMYKKLASEFSKAVKGRQLRNSNFLGSLLGMMIANNASMIYFHMDVYKSIKVDILAAQLMALNLTEIALLLGTSRHAAYLVAFPDDYMRAKNFAKTFSLEDLAKAKWMSKAYMSAHYFKTRLSRVGIETLRNASTISIFSAIGGLAPYYYLAVKKFGDPITAIGPASFDVSYHGLFIGLWAGVRYHIMKDWLFPDINKLASLQREKFKDDKLVRNTILAIEAALIAAIFGGNTMLASDTYTSWYESLSDLKNSLLGLPVDEELPTPEEYEDL